MRSDPYQARARELCLSSGVDPDSRVGEGRGHPAWCDFRDAARAEHNKREQDALAAVIAPQPAEFANAPPVSEGASQAASVRRCDGRRWRIRSVEGLGRKIIFEGDWPICWPVLFSDENHRSINDIPYIDDAP
jgi:hypothetical protein